MIYLHKILPFFVLPLGLTFVLVAAGVAFRRRSFCMAGLVLLWFSAMPVTDKLISFTHFRSNRFWVKTGSQIITPFTDFSLELF
jgi:hypothetical protein